MPRKIEISHRTIIFTVFLIVAVWFLFFIGDIILQVFVALLLMITLNPLVTNLSKIKIPRVLAVFLVYILLFSLIGFGLAGLVPLLVEQTTSFTNTLPSYLADLEIAPFISQSLAQELTLQIGQLPSQAVRVGVSIFENIINVLAVFVFAFYLLVERERLDDQLSTFFGDKQADRMAKVISEVEKRLGGWARGQLLLMITVGLSTYLGLLVLGVPFALSLGLLAGLLEIVPILGPILAAIPAVIVGFSLAPFTGFAVVALAFLIQQLENYVLVPKIMEKTVGISPIAILFSLAIGFKVAGIIGAFLSLPLIITILVLAKEFVFSK